MKQANYIFITGGVVSSLGKGIISASIGKLLQARGYKVTIQKFDPYINIDPGTLNPYVHRPLPHSRRNASVQRGFYQLYQPITRICHHSLICIFA